MYSVKIKVIVISILIIFIAAGCENSVIDTHEEKISTAGMKSNDDSYSANSVKINLNLTFGKQSLDMNKSLESNIGTHFNNIAKIDAVIEPGEELLLHEIQPYGIFVLYLTSDNVFELSNSDGMSFSSKSVLMEKCSFIDLKVKNPTQKDIHITGMLAGE